VTLKQSGPAFTMVVNVPEVGQVDLDLVAAFGFPLEMLRNHQRIQNCPQSRQLQTHKDFLVVPKR
jgi:hypothetical protein